jgi:NitT/TauT family transport system substrate-binding protein
MRHSRSESAQPRHVDRRTFLRRLGAGTALLAAGPGALAACGESRTAEQSGGSLQAAGKNAVRYGVTAIAAPYWNIFVAEDQGFLEDAGVIYRQVVTRGTVPTVQQMVGGALEGGGPFIDGAATAIDKGAPVIGVSMMPGTPFSLVVDRRIRSFDDLRGEKLGVTALDTSVDVLLRRMMSAEGIDEDAYTVVQNGAIPQRIASIKSGAIAGGIMAQPADFAFAATGAARVLAVSVDYVKHATVANFVRKDWAQEHRDTVTSFLRAQAQAWSWLADPVSEKQAVAILAKYTQVPKEAAQETYDLYRRQRIFDQGLTFDADAANTLLRLAEEAGQGPFKDAEAYFDSSYLEMGT